MIVERLSEECSAQFLSSRIQHYQLMIVERLGRGALPFSIFLEESLLLIIAAW